MSRSFGGALIMYGGRYARWFPRVGAPGSSLPHFVSISVGTEDFLRGANRHFVHWLRSRGGDVLIPTQTIIDMIGAQQVLTISTMEYENVDTSVIDPPARIRALIPTG